MKNLLFNIGKKSKKTFILKINENKKNKVLKDYYQLIEKNKKLILKRTRKTLKMLIKKNKENLIDRLVLNEKKF